MEPGHGAVPCPSSRHTLNPQPPQSPGAGLSAERTGANASQSIMGPEQEGPLDLPPQHDALAAIGASPAQSHPLASTSLAVWPLPRTGSTGWG